MAGVTHSSLRRGLAALIVGGAIAVGAGVVTGTQHAAAVGIPSKTCTGTGANGEAEPGANVTCTVSIVGFLATGDEYIVQPATPAGATISNCSDKTVTTPFAYTSKGALTSNACTWTISGVTGAAVGNLVLGDETLKIPAGTSSGTSVTQTMVQCGIVPPVIGTLTCGPSSPMGTSGAGSCVGGMALPIVGGCVPALPAVTPTPTPTPTASSSGGGGTGTTDNGQSTGGVQAAATAKSTPFTSGPEHPLPVAATLVAVGGALLVLMALGGPALMRRRRGR